MNPDIPFTYPGTVVEPSLIALYGKEDRKRFRLGNQIITKEWKEMLRSVSWDAYPSVSRDSIQEFLQAELGFIVSKQYVVKSVQAIPDNPKNRWFVSIQVGELDDAIVIVVQFDADSGCRIKTVEFVGYTPQDRVAFPMNNDTQGQPSSKPQASEYHCYGTNILHRNSIPGSVLTLDTSTVHTLAEKNHGSFSTELESNWPTILHPDSTKNP